MRKVSAFLLLTVLLVSFTCSFLGFPILPARAATETRYMANNVWVTGTYNLSKSNTASVVTTNVLTSYGYEYTKCYFGIKVYVGAADGTLTLVSGANPVAIATYTLASASQNFQVSASWAHSTVTQTGINVTIYAYADQNNPPTTLIYKFSTENMTAFATITSDTWTVYYAGREVWTGGSERSVISFKFGDATYVSYLTGFAVAAASIANPTYANVASSPTYPFGSNTLSFSTNWTAGEGSLDRYILSTNNTGSWVNQTAVAFSGGTWSNTTLTANATGDIQLGWRIYANNTSGGANNTGIQTLYIWKYVPPPSDHVLGQSTGFTWSGGIYFVGVHHVIYAAYQNSSVSPWEYWVAAYDVNDSLWYSADTGLSSSASDLHYNPSISVLPDGRLIMLIGYFTPLKFTVSMNNANTETNTSKLISQWSSLTNVNGTSIYSYPYPCHFSDRIVVFGREGASYGGNITEVTWKANITESHYVNVLNGSNLEWSHTGTTPYIDGTGTIYTTLAPKYEGWWNFTALNGTASTIQKVDLVILSTMISATTTVSLLSSGTIYNYTLTSGASQTSTFDVSAILNTPTLVANAQILITNVVASGSTTIYTAQLDVNYTGWTSLSTIFLPPAGFDSVYWNWNYNSTAIMGAGYGFSSTTGYFQNIYGMYSNDKGDTWRRMNETTSQTLPYNVTDALLYATNQYSRCAGPTWDENNHIIIAYHMYEAVYDQLSEQFKLGLCYYNSTLGSATGVWAIANATDVVTAAELTGYSDIGESMFLDSWYGRPSIWLAPDNLIKYVRVPNSVSQFLIVANDTINDGVAWRAGNIQESLGYYSVFIQEAYTKTFGTKTVGTTKQTLDDHTVWGTRFTPTQNGTLDWGMLWAEMNYSSSDAEWQMAVSFVSNGTLLANSTKGSLTSGISGTGWSIRTSFTASSNPTIYTTTAYWLSFRTNKNSSSSCLYNADPDNVNYTFYQTGVPYIGSFPSTLTPTGYQNWTITMFAAPSLLHVRGLGVMEFTDTGTNTTSRNVTCQFRTYVHCDNGLSYAYLRTNNSGSWLNTTYGTSLSGTARYVYFNVTTNDTTCVVLWEICVNDSNNNLGHTLTQTLSLTGGPITSLGSVGLAFSVNALKALTALIMRSSPFNFATDKLNSFTWAKLGNALLSFGVWFLNLFTNVFTSSSELSFSTVGIQGFQPSKIGSALIALGSESERAYAVVGSYVSDLAFSSSGVKGLSNPFAGSSMLSFVTEGYVAVAHAFSVVQSAVLSFASSIVDSFTNLFQNSASFSSGPNSLMSYAFGRIGTADLGFSATSIVSFSIAHFLGVVQSAVLGFTTALSQAWTNNVSNSGVFSFSGLEGLSFSFGRVSTATFNFNTYGSILASLITTWTFNGQAVLSFLTSMLPSRLALPLGSSFGVSADDTYEILFGFCFVMLVVVVGYGLSRREHEDD